MSTIDKALEKSHSYELNNDECFALLGAIESRIRFLKATIESESDGGIIEAAMKDKELLEEVLEKLGF